MCFTPYPQCLSHLKAILLGKNGTFNTKHNCCFRSLEMYSFSIEDGMLAYNCSINVRYDKKVDLENMI